MKKVYHLVDPNGVEWFIPHRGLNQFVGSHQEMFLPRDLRLVGKYFLATFRLHAITVSDSRGHWRDWSRYGAPPRVKPGIRGVAALFRWRAANPAKWLAHQTKNGEANLGSIRTGERVKMGPDHLAAKTFQLRSPDGIIYEGRNINEFIRTHSELFCPEDVAWKARKPGGRTLFCRAMWGLTDVSAGRKQSWKGWTVPTA